jgi:hypothetical protein
MYFSQVFTFAILRALVLEVSDVFLLFAVHLDNRPATCHKLPGLCMYELKVRIPFGVYFANLLHLFTLLSAVSILKPRLPCVTFFPYPSASFRTLSCNLSVVHHSIFSGLP